MESDNTLKLYRINEVSKLTTLGKSTINLWVAEHRFPKPILLSATIKVWSAKQIEEWINKSIEDTL